MTTHPGYRVDQSLSEWARDVLSRRVYAVLGTLDRGGSAHTVPVAYAFDSERFLIPSGASTRKVRNLGADPRARVLVQAPSESMGQTGWVAAFGTADVVDGEEAARLNAVADGRYLTDEGRRHYPEPIAEGADVTIIVTPQRWQSWNDGALVASLLERGYAAEDLERWFLPIEH